VQRVAPQIDPIYSQKLVLLLKCRGDNWEQEEGLLKAKRGDDRGLFKARSEQGPKWGPQRETRQTVC
jgi:hypothetical protein